MAGHGEVVRVNREPVTFAGPVGEASEQLVRDLCHRPALLADKMTVGSRRQVIRGGTTAEMRPVDDLQPLQLVEFR
jgi:hypothetical protein